MKDSPDSMGLPQCARDYINLVVRKMGYRRRIRDDVRSELNAHFADALDGIADEQERVEKAMALVKGFGEPKVLATLIRRGKKRCRPVWLKALIRCVQAAGVAILALILYVAWMFTGKPYISTDYVAEMNKLVRPVADESMNAGLYYDKAARLMAPEPNDPARPNDAEVTAESLATARAWVDASRDAMDQVRKGNEKPYCWRTYTTADGTLISVMLPELSDRRKLGTLFAWKAQLDASDGDFRQAFDDIRQSYLLGKHMETKGTLIEQLVAAAIKGRAAATARLIIAMPGARLDELAGFQKDYAELVGASDFKMHYDGESYFVKDMVQRTFTESGRVAPLALAKYVRSVSQTTGGQQGEVGLFETLVLGTYFVFAQPDKDSTLKESAEFRQICQRFAETTPLAARSMRPTIMEEANRLAGVNKLLGIMLPALERTVVVSWRNSADCHALIAQIGLERYKRDKGTYPESLEELQRAGYLSELPMDPWSDKPLIYRKTADGYTLYSVGTNFTDDGGKSVDSKGKPVASPNLDGLDIVFWPVTQTEKR
jgi:hypothetical protein